ncbi:SRPBCC family protein [Nocardia mexicana]|uniref:Polyketide cyclase/dehydrase/lipid transport protein n=1 Tax=Nocardia mexicana TaxID=279262 RepID=A0A370GNG3_9NOCA|nr:SRPBCC family protein [Nocardia mexicana]RDI45262.1 polyketide cyclase/dehydrase/lipid transport protein [Nocardia mexicana]
MIRLVIAAVVALAVLAGLIAVAVLVVLRRRTRTLLSHKATPLPDRDLEAILTARPTFAMTTTCHLHAPPQRVWNALEDGAFSWLPFINGIRYTGSDRGVGALRKLDTPLFAADEQVTHCRPHQRLTAVGIGTSIPLFAKSYVQDFELTPTSDGGTDLAWTVSGRPAVFAFLPLSWTALFIRPFARVALGWMIRP